MEFKNKNGPLAEAKGRLSEQRRSLKSDRCFTGRSSLVTAAAAGGRSAAARLAGRSAAAGLAALVAIAHAVQLGMQPLAERRLAAAVARIAAGRGRSAAGRGRSAASRGGRGAAGRGRGTAAGFRSTTARLTAAATTVEQTGIGVLGGGDGQHNGHGQRGKNGTQFHGEVSFVGVTVTGNRESGSDAAAKQAYRPPRMVPLICPACFPRLRAFH